MLKQIFIFVGIVVSIYTISAQDYPYPDSPGNTNFINNYTPTLKWIPSANFVSYKIEIEMCSYDKGSSFDVLELENFIYQEVKNGKIGYEASALTYNLRRPENYSTVDDGGEGFADYMDSFNDRVARPSDSFAGSDYEGMTYLYNDYFVMVEERLDYLIFLKFNYNNQSELTSINELNTIYMNNSFITNNNKGWEGLTYNPKTSKLYLAKEISPTLFYETDLPGGSDFTGAVNLSQPFNINNTSWAPTDVSGLFHVALDIRASATPAGDHILILSQEDEKIFEIDLNGNLVSEKEFNSGGLFGSATNGFFKPEGITYQNGDIWIVSDTDPGVPARYFRFTDPYYEPPIANNNGLVYTKININGSQYQLPNGILTNNTEYCWRVIGINANGQQIPSEYYSLTTNAITGCKDNGACNYNPNATENDGLCLYLDCENNCGGLASIGSACNDSNSQTINDQYNNNCICQGIVAGGCIDANACNYNNQATMDDGSCLYIDCKGVCGGSAILNAPCNDNNAQTINDKYNSSCVCKGVIIYGCTDVNACNYNANATANDSSCTYEDCLGNCGGSAVNGASCNDNDPLTANDQYNASCECIGTIVFGCADFNACNYSPFATFNNGSCLYEDCLGICGGTSLPNTSCYDGNPSTVNDKYNNNCICVGDLLEGCTNAAACNYNPLALADNGTCEYVIDCLGNCGGPTRAGSACNDGDALTINDVYDLFCNCRGVQIRDTLISICFNITNGNNDAEETATNGAMNFTSGDLDLADLTSKIVGMRFDNIDIPFGANIINAFLQFKADEANNQLTNLIIAIENSNNASTITSNNHNISARNYINQVVPWNNVAPWVAGESGGAQRSPGLAELVQQVINKNGWQTNNSILVKVTGSGKRAAKSYNSGNSAPQLCVDYFPFGCPENLTLSDAVIDNQTISVEYEIESTSSITNSAVNYFAGDTITLMSGFEIDDNSDFRAEIQNCE